MNFTKRMQTEGPSIPVHDLYIPHGSHTTHTSGNVTVTTTHDVVEAHATALN